MATSLHAGAGSGSDTGSDRVPPLDRSRHLKYWKRCLRTVLPTQYTSMDSTRMTLGFFILSAIDLLSAPSESSPSAADTQQSQQPQSQASEPESLLTATDRRQLRDWVLACQHPSGGFAGSPTHAVPHNTAKLAGGVKEGAGTANLAATAFALLLLPLLAEDDGDGSGASSRAAYSGVRRRETLAWLRRLQREDGSFGEMLAEDLGGGSGVRIAGSRDMRFAYFAAMVRWMLRCGEGEDEEDINVDALVKFISRAQTYDGGFAETGDNEPHAGYTFCAIATLAMLDRSLPTSKSGRSGKSALRTGLRDPVACVRWLVSRPFAYIEASSDDSDSDSQGPHNQPQEDDADSYEPCFPDALPNPPPRTPPHFVAFNGRCNKAADTCYAWWVSGALALLLGSGPPSGYEAIVDRAAAAAARDFLLARTQHVLVGGFGKHVGSRPDIYHSYLGLAALAVLPGGIGCRGRPGSDGSGGLGLKELDPGLCVSVDTRRKIEAARAGLRVPSGSGAPRAEESLSTRLLALARGLETAGGKPAPVAS